MPTLPCPGGWFVEPPFPVTWVLLRNCHLAWWALCGVRSVANYPIWCRTALPRRITPRTLNACLPVIANTLAAWPLPLPRCYNGFAARLILPALPRYPRHCLGLQPPFVGDTTTPTLPGAAPPLSAAIAILLTVFTATCLDCAFTCWRTTQVVPTSTCVITWRARIQVVCLRVACRIVPYPVLRHTLAARAFARTPRNIPPCSLPAVIYAFGRHWVVASRTFRYPF